MMRGATGVVTDGGLRDAATIGALEMPAYHARPSSPTNLTLHEAIEINCPVGCGDAPVFPGDIVVGDDDCVIIIPADIAEVYIRHKNCLTYENVNDLMDIVLCFIIIPAIYLIIFRDFRTESFLFAALALILYQFLNYGLAKLEQERKELWGQDKSFI